MGISFPLDSTACGQADDVFYCKHDGEASLFDAAGDRVPLSADDPAQDGLRDDWCDIYEAALAHNEDGSQPFPDCGKPGHRHHPEDCPHCKTAPEDPKKDDPKKDKPKKDDPVNPVQPCDKANLAVVVKDADGKPVEGAIVDVAGLGAIYTDANGLADYGQVDAGTYDVSAEKRGYAPGKTDPAGPDSTVADVPCNQTTVVDMIQHPVQSVTQIKGKMPGTNGVRKASDTRPDDTHDSSSADLSLTTNKPVILVRGCREVVLEAVTSPANQPVDWSIDLNDNPGGTKPTLTPTDGGKKAKLKTDQTGSFAVTAALGATKIVWNVVFVHVNVKAATTTVTTRNNKFADSGGGGAGWTQFRSGQFSAGNYAWEAEVKVEVIGGGADKKLGIDQVEVRVLQNGTADTLTATYAPGETALEVPKGGLPVLDANDATDPLLFVASVVSTKPNQTDKDRTVWTGDSPAGAFPNTHANTGTTITAISGINGFRTCIASFSKKAKSSIVVHARIDWSADYSGTVAVAAGVATYTPTTAKATSDARYALVSAATGGQDAKDAGMETFEPRFNSGTNTTWTP